ncbi:hypothetical protein CEXT_478961 [Caerostris extrusa]|uniref:Uncharacterized protein n=1 Tax=Caerostris extrusa TaxID=172846 RepID=A0AAV4Y9P4_CAEEX|nr:hypothetical protein CEXT_478961 [Caerostris extrusa]
MALLRPLLHGARYGNQCMHTSLATDIRCSNIDHAECERLNPRDDSQELPASLPSSLDCHQMNLSQWHTDTTEDWNYLCSNRFIPLSICDDSRAPFYESWPFLRPLLHTARYGNGCLHTSLAADIRCLNIDHAEYECPNPRDDSQELPASLRSSLDCRQMNPSQWHTDIAEDVCPESRLNVMCGLVSACSVHCLVGFDKRQYQI